MGEHTPTPWKIDARQFSQHGLMHISCGHYIVAQALGQMATCESEAKANAAFIVEAVNSYDRNRATIDALVGALERIADPTSMWSQHAEIARSALQLARGSKGDE